MSKVNMTMSGGNSALEMNMNPKQSGTGGTSNYNDLQNKPSINNVELVGDKTAKELGLVDEATYKALEEIVAKKLNDILINGTSIVTDGKANIPLSSKDVYGVVKPHTSMQFTNGELGFKRATQDNLSKRNYWFAIDSQNIDIAVKSAMCDGVGTEWTVPEKASARNRLGVDLVPLFEPIIIEEDLTGATSFELPYPCSKIKILVKQPADTTSISLYCGIAFEGQYSTGSGALMGSANTVANKYISFDLNVLGDGIVECLSNSNATTKYINGLISEFTDYADKRIAKVGLNTVGKTLPLGTEIRVLGVY